MMWRAIPRVFPVVFVLLLGVAVAAQGTGPLRLTMQFLLLADLDGDGVVYVDVFEQLPSAAAPGAFAQLDRNADGALSPADLPQGPLPGPRELVLRLLRQGDIDENDAVTMDEAVLVVPALEALGFELLDKTVDGALTRVDVSSFCPGPCDRLSWFLACADGDADGEVSFEELRVLAPDLTPALFAQLYLSGDGILGALDMPQPVDLAQRARWMLAEVDTDGDGVVTFLDFKALVPDLDRLLFMTLDVDADGLVTLADLPAILRDPRERLVELLKQTDIDGDSAVASHEFEARFGAPALEQFGQLDLTGDGLLTVDDMTAGPVPVDDDSRCALLEALVHADANGDGVLEYAEVAEVFPDAPSELTAALDADGDGLLIRTELSAVLSRGVHGRVLVHPHDVDASRATNSIDIQLVVNQTLGRPSQVLPADVDGDGTINSVDIQTVVFGALSGE